VKNWKAYLKCGKLRENAIKHVLSADKKEGVKNDISPRNARTAGRNINVRNVGVLLFANMAK
jgi:hypothetical protein